MTDHTLETLLDELESTIGGYDCCCSESERRGIDADRSMVRNKIAAIVTKLENELTASKARECSTIPQLVFPTTDGTDWLELMNRQTDEMIEIRKAAVAEVQTKLDVANTHLVLLNRVVAAVRVHMLDEVRSGSARHIAAHDAVIAAIATLDAPFPEVPAKLCEHCGQVHGWPYYREQ